jgi:hypothetical protein
MIGGSRKIVAGKKERVLPPGVWRTYGAQLAGQQTRNSVSWMHAGAAAMFT